MEWYSMAARALANAWVHITYSLWCKRECYTVAILTAAQHVHVRQVA